jgi:uncharacterized protein (TIGR02453 family)
MPIKIGGINMNDIFNGFHEESLKFLIDLANNNNKQWFDINRSRYEKYILDPSKSFVTTIGPKLKSISLDINADPRVNYSLFRLNRDVRFSPDKSPYKTHIGIIFWEGPRKRMECPGFYLQINPDSLMLAGGMHLLPKDMIELFRNVVAKEGPAKELAHIVENVKNTGIDIGGLHYKRTPRDYTEDHPYSFFLKYNGVYGITTIPMPKEFFTSKFVTMAYDTFKKIDPLNRWFLKYLY